MLVSLTSPVYFHRRGYFYFMQEKLKEIIEIVSYLPLDEKVAALNEIRKQLHEISPFKNEPVDLVQWVKNETVHANTWNPNSVASVEMELLELSIMNDGYTQPIVTWTAEARKQAGIDGDINEVVDGFHRNRVGKESKIINKRIHGYLPIVGINKERTDKNDRIASTIRHNRARGKHQIDAMSEIVIELKNRNWSNERVAKQLGMDIEEVLRLCQISGLEHLFSDRDFSRAWESSDTADFEPITDNVEDYEQYRTANTNDPDRIFHTHDKWECHKAGFYASRKEGLTAEQCEVMYANFLSDDERFRMGLNGVIKDWKHSCEHYLTNRAMNRIAWLGQAAMCYGTGVPSVFCSGFNQLTPEQQNVANETALEYLNLWLTSNDRQAVTMEAALSLGRQIDIY
jgi:ParB-like chromosome segregation protein Spo0J